MTAPVWVLPGGGETVVYRYVPDLELWRAVLASSAIPRVFPEVPLPVGPRGATRLCWDGGLVANVPAGEAATLWPARAVISFSLGAQLVPPPARWRTLRYYAWLVEQVIARGMMRHEHLGWRLARALDGAPEVRVHIDRLGVQATDFRLSAVRREQLLDSGYRATRAKLPDIRDMLGRAA